MHSFNNPGRQRPDRSIEVGTLYPFTVGRVGEKYRAIYLFANADATAFPDRETYNEAQDDARFARDALTQSVKNAAERARVAANVRPVLPAQEAA